MRLLAAIALASCQVAPVAPPCTASTSGLSPTARCELGYLASTATATPTGAVTACPGLVLNDSIGDFTWLEAAGPDAGSVASKLRK